MKKSFIRKTTFITVLSACLLLMLTACGAENNSPAGAVPGWTPIPGSPSGPAGTQSSQAAPAGETQTGTAQAGAADTGSSPSSAAGPKRADGERFETAIILEGMEETVRYEHIRNDALGFEMDYDYESFVRQTETECERFISVYDDPADPQYCLEVTRSPEDAETAAASVSKVLSEDYEINREDYPLDHAGTCIRIDASAEKGGLVMPEILRMVYIIPAEDGSIIASTHCAIEGSEGFGRRFSYIVKTIEVIDKDAGQQLTDEQAVNAVRNYCLSANPDLKDIAEAGEYPVYWEISSSDDKEIVVVFRSYTGSLNYYYIDRTSGDTYVTEFVPGITAEEEKTDESFNVKDYQ